MLERNLATLAVYLGLPKKDLDLVRRSPWPRSGRSAGGTTGQVAIPVFSGRDLALPGALSNKGKCDLEDVLAVLNHFRSRRGRLFTSMLAKMPTVFGDQTLFVPSAVLSKLGAVMLACRRKIRIIDPSAGEVTVVLTIGLPNSYIENEIAVRSRLAPLIETPAILKMHLDRSPQYYVERFINGHSLRRADLRSPRGATHIRNFLTHLWDVYGTEADLHVVDFGSWTDELVEQLRKNRLFSRSPARTTVERAILDVQTMGQSGLLPRTIQICQSHGDLTHDNLIMKDDVVYLLDWENTRRLSIFHDFINFHILSCAFLSQRPRVGAFLRGVVAVGDHNEAQVTLNVAFLRAYVILWFLEKVAFLHSLGDEYGESEEMTYKRLLKYQELFATAMTQPEEGTDDWEFN